MSDHKGITVLVTGGCDYSDKNLLYVALDFVHHKHIITKLLQGGATGADFHAANWALDRNVNVRTFPADWETQGAKAGPLRNQAMVDERPDLVVAFPGGKGTSDCKRRAKAAGIRVWTPVEVSTR